MSGTTKRAEPYIWVTWVVGLLAGDDNCHWSAWFKGHFKHTPVNKDDGPLKKWKNDHANMVSDRVALLRKQGYTVYMEDQNKFNLKGKTGITLGGTPDIVAVNTEHVLVVDCKSGKRRDKDYWQVVIYMLMLPHTHEEVKKLDPKRPIIGQVQYRDGILKIGAEEAIDVADVVTKQIQESGGVEQPKRVASKRECKFCNIGRVDCPVRIDEADTGEPRHHTDIF